MIDLELRARIADLYAAYAECICDGDLAQWPEFFREDYIDSRVRYETLDRHLGFNFSGWGT